METAGNGSGKDRKKEKEVNQKETRSGVKQNTKSTRNEEFGAGKARKRKFKVRKRLRKQERWEKR